MITLLYPDILLQMPDKVKTSAQKFKESLKYGSKKARSKERA
jgi:hypothetical protein